ncbi:S49 family peptidase [Novosphingobium gossypii]|uniref:S49 family peptidase n=1 Tax=Novosphingobium gossypii TaxID=1604774 RepID=UPI003D1EBA23
MRPPRPQGFPNIAGQLLNRPLAIHPHKAEVLVCALQQRLGIVEMKTIDGVTLEAKEMLDRADFARKDALARDATYSPDGSKPYRMDGNIAVITIEGTLVQKAGWLDAMSGFCGYNMLQRQFEAAFEDSDVLGIWVEIDSPGGSVAGLMQFVEFLAMHTQSMGGKPAYAWVNEMACSAAYAIASVCDKIFGPRDATVGSIGCVMVHTSLAGALEENGINVTVIRSGERKYRGNQYEDLDDATMEKFQGAVDATRITFANLVAMGRDIPVDDVLATEADWFEGEEGVRLGLMDEVLTERQAWTRLEDEVDRIKQERRRAA